MVVVLLAVGSAPVGAQVIGPEAIRTLEGRRLDFRPDGVWRVRARRVRAARHRVSAALGLEAVNAAGARLARAPGATAVTGTLRMPAVLLDFSDTDTLALGLPDRAAYDGLLFAPVPSGGRPYTLRSFYDEMSNGVLTVDGGTFGWIPTDSSLAWVMAPCPASGGLCTLALQRLAVVFRQALARVDATVDFGQFDNDGPDNIPNSGDDDGVVDVVQFVQPRLGGECGGPGLWAHKSSLSANDPITGTFLTNDSSAAGPIAIDSYYIVSGVGGANCTDTTALMDIGVAAHELGHGLGLPDLYDTGGGSQGIGEWGLMGSGMYTSLPSPAHYEAWSKEQMGWVALRELVASGRYTLPPVVSSDTVFLVRPVGSNPRSEYFLLENRQPEGADTANLLTGNPRTGPKNGGLLVWHIDSVTVAQRLAVNTVNAGPNHGVALVQADGLDQLDLVPSLSGSNRGDAGDVYPGSSRQTRYAFDTTPAASLNADGSFPGMVFDSITEGVSGRIDFVLIRGRPNVVRASDTSALVRVDGVDYARFEGFLDPLAGAVVEIDSVQSSVDGRSTYRFRSWSDGGARQHTVNGVPMGDSVVAKVDVRHRLSVTAAGGTVTGPRGADAGTLLPADTTVRLVAAADTGYVFLGWSGDTLAATDTLWVRMSRPFDLVAGFETRLVFADTLPPAAVVGAAYSHRLTAGGIAGAATFRVAVSGTALPPGLALDAGGTVSGIPEAEGVFVTRMEILGGSQSLVRDVTFRVGAPALLADDVLAHYLRTDVRLTPDEERYLDLAGNRDGTFDLGDLLAWLEREGLSAPPPGGSTALLRRPR